MEKSISSHSLFPKRHKTYSHKIFIFLILCLGFLNSSFGQTNFNGLTKSGSNFTLGGTLTQNTTIDLGTSYFFKLSKSSQDYLIVTNGGNIGIGTASPSAQLHTTGSVRFNTLAGTGTRMVVADVNGVLATQSIPSGGSTSPAGSNTHVQFNNNGSFGGEAAFVWNSTIKSLEILGGQTIVGQTDKVQLSIKEAPLQTDQSDIFQILSSGGTKMLGIGKHSNYTYFDSPFGNGKIWFKQGVGLGNNSSISNVNAGGEIRFESDGGMTIRPSFQENVSAQFLGSGAIQLPKLATNLSAPVTSGTTKMVITDQNGLLSYADIPSGASGSFIQNQNASAQTGNFWIDGNGTIGNNLQVNGASQFQGDIWMNGITKKIFSNNAEVTFNVDNSGGVRMQSESSRVSVNSNHENTVDIMASNIRFGTDQWTANGRPISSLNDANGYHALTLASNQHLNGSYTTRIGGAFISQAKHYNSSEVYESGKMQFVYNNGDINSGRLGLFVNDAEKLSVYKNGNVVIPSLATGSSQKMVVTDQNGLLSYQDISSGSGSIIASNGLSATANNVMLGGMLNQNTSISSGAGGDNPQYDFTIFSRQTADAWQYNYLKASGGQFVIGNNSLNYNGNIPLLKINGYDGGYSGNAVRANCGINVDARSDAWGIDGYGGKFEYTTFTSGQAGNANRNHYGVLSIVNFTGDGSGYNAYGGYFKAVNSATGTNNNAWGVYVDAGNVFIRDIANASLNTNKFLVSDGGVVKYRTASEMLSDLGVSGGGSVSLPSNQIAYGTGNSLTGNSNLTFDGSTFAINTANLTPSSYAQYKLAVNGNAIFTRVKVRESSQWADYVFEPSYKLPTLTEVEAFIKQYKHLPEVPSAEEVKKEGIDIGDNQAVLLKKIEELTLYIIDQNKKIEALEEKVEKLGRK